MKGAVPLQVPRESHLREVQERGLAAERLLGVAALAQARCVRGSVWLWRALVAGEVQSEELGFEEQLGRSRGPLGVGGQSAEVHGVDQLCQCQESQRFTGRTKSLSSSVLE